MAGEPLKIVELDEGTGELILNEINLERIFRHEKCLDSKVCVISLAGDFNKGKSFLLNFLMKYLNADDKEKWLDDKKSPLKGKKVFLLILKSKTNVLRS